MKYKICQFFDDNKLEEIKTFINTNCVLQDGIKSIVQGDTNIEDHLRRLKNNREAIINDKQFLKLIGDIGKDWIDFTVPKSISNFIYSVTDEGGFYKPHIDQPTSGHFSTTIFFNNPEDYEGGELELYIDNQVERFKLKAGYGIIYETGIPHAVATVTNGTRKVLCFWTSSMISDKKDLYEYRLLLAKAPVLMPICETLEEFISNNEITSRIKANTILQKYLQ